MILLGIGVIIFIGLILYFVWAEIEAEVFPRLGFEDKEEVNLEDVHFVSVLPEKNVFKIKK